MLLSCLVLNLKLIGELHVLIRLELDAHGGSRIPP